MHRSESQFRTIRLAVAALWALATLPVQAQSIYRIVGPDGSVSFSDQPPAANQKATILSASGRAAAADSEASGLPVALRQVASRYPVTLYTGDNCEPCNSGRSLLSSRGVPFTERTVTTQQDADALQKLSAQNSLPLLAIGGQQLKGFQSSDWAQYLDAAGYPPSSQLPAGYRNPPASPLAPTSKPTPATAENRSDDFLPPPPSAPAPSNPAGIRF